MERKRIGNDNLDKIKSIRQYIEDLPDIEEELQKDSLNLLSFLEPALERIYQEENIGLKSKFTVRKVAAGLIAYCYDYSAEIQQYINDTQILFSNIRWSIEWKVSDKAQVSTGTLLEGERLVKKLLRENYQIG